MLQSKFIQINKDVLLEYIYDSSNLISETYKVLVNTIANTRSFISSDTSATKNTQDNTLFILDRISNKYGLVNTTKYPFLQTINYANSLPIRYDKVRLYFPALYDFNQYQGFQLSIYAKDRLNNNVYLTDFFYDKTNPSTISLIDFANPSIRFAEKEWINYIEINIPSAFAVANQLSGSNPAPNSINSNLTNAVGLSTTSPILIDFSFIQLSQTINATTTYLLEAPIQTSVPLSPDFETISVMIEESTNGDFFEIYGTYNSSLADFNKFINDSFLAGKRYVVEYVISLYQENIKSRPQVRRVTSDFNLKEEYRPIIKLSTTTAIIEVEMRLIDLVDDSTITRRATFGLLPYQVSKYSTNLTKIQVQNANSPIIYNKKVTNILSPTQVSNKSNVIIEQIQVPFPVMIDKYNVVAKSNSVQTNSDLFYGIGKLQIIVYPFDNIVKFVVQQSVDASSKIPFDFTSAGTIKLVFKNAQLNVECLLLNNNPELDLKNGVVIFKINNNQISDIRKIYQSGVNPFYINISSNGVTTVVYSGTFIMYDAVNNLEQINNAQIEQVNTNFEPTINLGSEPVVETIPTVQPSVIIPAAPNKVDGRGNTGVGGKVDGRGQIVGGKVGGGKTPNNGQTGRG